MIVQEYVKRNLLSSSQCYSLVVDKIDMHIALDLSNELKEIASAGIEVQKARILTTNLKNDDTGTSLEIESFKLLKKAFFSDQKALII